MTDIRELLKIMRALRDPARGCPWDLEQDYRSIAPHTIEEAYEVADAIARGDAAALLSELGDLLLQVVFLSQLAAEAGDFTFDDVCASLQAKLIERHPHVFGDEPRSDSARHSERWETIKAADRSRDGAQSELDDVPLALPALSRAQKLQQRAARIGFDWPSLAQCLAKFEEERLELLDALDQRDIGMIAAELGDVMFSLVNAARQLDIDAESSLRAAGRRFEQRFRYIERQLAASGRSAAQASLSEMDALWDQAKAAGL